MRASDSAQMNSSPPTRTISSYGRRLDRSARTTRAQNIPSGVSVRVVDRLQAVDVHVGDNEPTIAASGSTDLPLELGQAWSAAPRAGQGIGGVRTALQRRHGSVTSGRFPVTSRLPAVVGCLCTMERGPLSIGLSLLTITGRPQDDLLTGWRRLPAIVGEQLAQFDVTLRRLLVPRGGRGIPCFGGEVPGAGGCIAADRRFVPCTRCAEPLAGGVQPGPGGPGAGQIAVLVTSLTGACRQVSVAGGLVGVCRQLVAVGGDLVTVGAALVTIRARLFAVSLGLLVVSPRLLDL
jgi:hypothetical protein